MRTVERGLLEREAEVARIEAAIEDACAERAGSFVLVEGPAGIGKTALLRAAAEIPGEQMTVLSARATELEREFPFGTVRQLLEPALRSAPPQRRDELLAGAAARAAPALGLAGVESVGADPGFATLNGLYWLISAITEHRPLLLLLDDIHWADRDSLRFLAFMIPRLADLPVLLLAAARPEEWRADVSFAATASDPAARPVTPKELSPEATAAIVDASFDVPVDPALARACHKATGGNPFYLRALLDELRRDGAPPSAAAATRVLRLGPRAVTQTIVARLARLSSAAPRVAKALAILEDEAEHGRAARLAEVDQGEAKAATEAMINASILAPAGGLTFAHPIIRNAVYQDIGRAERAELHRRAIDLLRADGAAPERVVAHLLAVEPMADQAMVDILRSAAADALQRGAVGSATAYLRRALAEPPSPGEKVEVLLQLGSAEMLVDGPAAVEHLTDAFEHAERPLDRATVATDLARALIFAGRGTEAVAVAERAIAELGRGYGERRRALEALILAVASTDPALAELRGALIPRLREGEALDADDAGARALMVGLGYVDAHACIPAAEVLPRMERGLSGGLLLEHDNGGADFIATVIVFAMADSELALPTLTDGLRLARERGDVFAWAANKIFSCLAHLVRGELAAAVAAGEEGLAASDSYGITIGRPWGGGYLATAQLATGEIDAAERTLARVGAPEEVPFNGVWAPFVDARARVRAARGEPRAALADSLWCGRLLGALGMTNPALLPWRSRAALCLAQLGDDLEQARQLVEEEIGFARNWGAPRALGAALWARGLVVGGAAGTVDLHRAVDVLDGSPARLEYARALVDLGAALRREGHRRHCREPLREGMSLARSCGAVPLAERAYEELRVSGARPRKLIYAGVEALTPGERRVAQLAAEGRANREIAQELFVSVKTVEWHLGQVFRKLDISSRKRLAGTLVGER